MGVGSPFRGIAGRSRATSRWHRLVTPEQDVDRFIEDVGEAVHAGGYDVVFGARDAEVLALSQARDWVRAVVPLAAHERVVAAFDKVTLGQAAEASGVVVPRSLSDDEVLSDQAEAVVKARIHPALERAGSPARIETAIVRGEAERWQRVSEIEASGRQAMVQERITGTLMALSLLLDQGGAVTARVQQRAERIFPSQVGVSARARTVEVDEELAERCTALLHRLRWFGLAQLQFVVPDGEDPHLIDFNGRFYGSLALAIAAGVNFPALSADLAIGRRADGGDGAPGVRYQWLLGDLRRAAQERRGGLARDLAGTVRFAGAAHSLASISDPAPAARGAAARLGRFAKQRLPWFQ